MPASGDCRQDRRVVLQDARMDVGPVLPPGLGLRAAVVGQQIVVDELPPFHGIDVTRVAAPDIAFQAPHSRRSPELPAGRLICPGMGENSRIRTCEAVPPGSIACLSAHYSEERFLHAPAPGGKEYCRSEQPAVLM